jgi:WD40 repeat protein
LGENIQKDAQFTDLLDVKRKYNYYIMYIVYIEMIEEYDITNSFGWTKKKTMDGYACANGVAISGDKFAAAVGRCGDTRYGEDNPKWTVKIYDMKGELQLTLRNSLKSKKKFMRLVVGEEGLVEEEWTGRWESPADSTSYLGEINFIAMDGNLVVAGGVQKDVYLWDIGKVSDREHVEPVHILEGHEDKVNTVALMGDTIVSGSSDGTVKIWNTTGLLIKSIDFKIGVSKVGMNKDIIAVTAGRGDLHVISRTDMSLKTISLGETVDGFAVGDNIIATSPENDRVELRDLKGKLLQEPLVLPSDKRCKICEAPIARQIAIDGDRIVVGSEYTHGKTITVWNTKGEFLSEIIDGRNIKGIDIQGRHIIASGETDGENDKIFILTRRDGAGGLQRSGSNLKSYPKLKY